MAQTPAHFSLFPTSPIDIVLGIALGLSGFALCLLACLQIVVLGLKAASTGVEPGRSTITWLGLFIGPLSGCIWASLMHGHSQAETCIYFGWGNAPTFVAICCLADLEDTDRGWTSSYVATYFIGAALAGLAFTARLILSDDSNAFLYMLTAAVFIVVTSLAVWADEQNRQAASRPQSALPDPRGDRHPFPAANEAALPFKPAPPDLGNDFDVPPQR